MKREPIAIPRRPQLDPIVIEQPAPITQANNHEVSSPTTIRWLAMFAMADIGIWSGLVAYVLSLAAGTLSHPLVLITTLVILAWRVTHRREEVMLIISGEYPVVEEIRSRERVSMEQLSIVREAANNHHELLWAELNNNAEATVEQLRIESQEQKLRSDRDFWKSKAASTQVQQDHSQNLTPPRPAIRTHTDTLGLFQEWLEQAYHSVGDDGFPKGREPWSLKGEWEQRDKDNYKSWLEPELIKMVPPIIRKAGNRTRLNLGDYPSITEATRAMEELSC